jgi:hypothetical protein
MEEQETEKELLELNRHRVTVEEFRLTDRRDSERVHQVVLKTLRSFISHLNSIL